MAFDGANARALLASCGFLPGRGGSLVYRSPDETARQQLLKQTAVFEACFQDEKSGVLELLGYFYLLFACMDRRRPGRETPGPDGRPGRGEAGELSGPERYFRQAEDYLQNNFAYPVRVRQLARQLGVSRTCLYKAFRSCSGKSVQQYLQDLRLEAACRFLADGDGYRFFLRISRRALLLPDLPQGLRTDAPGIPGNKKSGIPLKRERRQTGREDYSGIRDRAASSATTVTSPCSCRTEAGTAGVTGPYRESRRIWALSAPLTISRIFLAFIMVPMPMV